MRTTGLAMVCASIVLAGCSAGANDEREVQASQDGVIAALEVGAGRITFIDETVGDDVEVGILEQGNADLDAMNLAGASPLAIFKALAPGREPPQRLVQHARLRGLSAAAPGFIRPRVITENLGASDTVNCWGWGDLHGYNSSIGNDPDAWNGHDRVSMKDEFTAWSGISGAVANDYYDQDAEISDKQYVTNWSHHRAFGMCVTHAAFPAWEGAGACLGNTVDLGVKLFVETSSGTSSTATIHLTGYGYGARYRSSSTSKRKHTFRVVDYSQAALDCKERYDVHTRHRSNLTPGPGDITDFARD